MAPLNASRAPASPSFDDNDDLFNSADIDEIFREVDTSTKIDIHDTKPSKNDSKDLGATLGIDEEVKVTKKRKPIAKLDDARLLSQAGIPKLRQTAKQKLKFKGKGHEYTDAARLLNFYQLWLDDLYPRAKFSDGLAMVEKLGHSKRMQVMRREWIDEGKPKRDLDDFPVAVDAERDGTRHEGGAQTGKEVDGSVAAPGEREEAEQAAELERSEPGAHPEGLEDLEEPTQPMSLFGGGRVKKKEKGNQLFVSDDEEEDDLNALLAAQTSNQGMNATAQKQSSDIQKETETQEENFDDDMEAMAGFDDPW